MGKGTRADARFLGDSGRGADLARTAAYAAGPIRKLKADESEILNGAFRDCATIRFEIAIGD